MTAARALSPLQIDCLLVAVLATYSYPLDKAWALREAMRRQGLGELAKVATSSVEQVGNQLKAAGYDRGGINYILAPRLIALAKDAEAGALAKLPQLVSTRAKDEAITLLESLHGFGPKAAELAWQLLATG